MRKKAKTLIHVNQHFIKHNAKNPDNLKPVLTIKQGRKNTYANEVEIIGPAKVVYSPDKPLSCGAKVWISCADAIIKDGVDVGDVCGF